MTSLAIIPMHPAVAEVQRWLARPFAWGECDCITVLADWILHARGVDPMADLRLTYSTAGECQRVTGFLTDPLGVLEPRLVSAGLARVDTPRIGDVGLLLAIMGPGAGSAVHVRPHGGLFLGRAWAAKAESGVTIIADPDKIAAIWRVLD